MVTAAIYSLNLLRACLKTKKYDKITKKFLQVNFNAQLSERHANNLKSFAFGGGKEKKQAEKI